MPEGPLLLALLVGLLFGLVTAGLLHAWVHRTAAATASGQGDLVAGVLALAAFALGAFATYVLIGFL